MGDGWDQPNKPPRPGRPSFSRTEAPIGLYNGEHAIIVYELRPIPPWPKNWINLLANQFRRELDPAPKIDIALAGDCIRFSIFVSNEVSVADLCKLDDAVDNAVDNAGRAIEYEQTALNEKLDQVRKRRLEVRGE
ncbi:MAG: hypothetical protein JOZ23_10395 [Mycobacterium sp.]|nr:hypothetical protein [Mycobacterium sp.]MBV9351928.1 hypothetical protein [Mycobacterium sp.]